MESNDLTGPPAAAPVPAQNGSRKRTRSEVDEEEEEQLLLDGDIEKEDETYTDTWPVHKMTEGCPKSIDLIERQCAY